ncbi:MAG: hypothetical protein WD048_01035 [Chitinophagales bacterium]
MAFLLLCVLTQCGKEEVERIEPDVEVNNPYDAVDPNSDLPEELDLDSASILGLHTYIFSLKCAIPACHDGSFEPDFRTVSSSYNSLVLHPVLKNDAQQSFSVRVNPGDSTSSWLYERITTDDPVLGRMPLYDVLGQKEIKTIAKWIQQGAKNIEGSVPQWPAYKTNAFGYLAYLPDQANYRVDTIRYKEVQVYPFYVPQGENLKFYAGLYNLSPEGDFEAPLNLTEAKMLFSVNDPYLFNNASSLNLNFSFTPFMGPYFLNETLELPYFYDLTINTSQFDKGDIVYFRIQAKNAQQNGLSTIPSKNAPGYYAPLYSFIVY